MKDLKKLRIRFRENTFARDKCICQGCYMKFDESQLDAHHITDRNEIPSNGYTIYNGITLCKECHLKAEKWHMSGNREWVEGFHPDELYKKIGSSYEKAFISSENGCD